MTIGAIPQIVIGFIVFGILFIVTGVVIDNLLPVWNDMDSQGVPHSAIANWTLTMLCRMVTATTFTCVFTYGMFSLLNGLQSQSGEI